MKYSHEVPRNLLGLSRFFNDFDYALDIKFDDSEYYNFFKESIKLGREVWLDNSLYERRITGISFNESNYVQYIKNLNPTYYIVPDDYESSEANIELFNNWISKYNLELISNKKIVVVHGSSYEDYVKCYQYFDRHVKEEDIISFSGGDTFLKKENITRPQIIKKMYLDGIINLKRKHHLLGSVSPDEVQQYYTLNFIYSIDTSLPVIATYEKNKLEEITEKPKSIIHNIFEKNIEWDLDLLYKNIIFFRTQN